MQTGLLGLRDIGGVFGHRREKRERERQTEREREMKKDKKGERGVLEAQSSRHRSMASVVASRASRLGGRAPFAAKSQEAGPATNLKPWPLSEALVNRNPKPQTLTLNPKPQTLNPKPHVESCRLGCCHSRRASGPPTPSAAPAPGQRPQAAQLPRAPFGESS